MMEIKLNLSVILAMIYLLLFVFGWVYNALVMMAEKQHYTEGYMSLIVAFGVGMTLLPFAFFTPPLSVMYIYFAFMASGLPMILGSIWRHVVARKREQDDERQAARLAK
ncbi:conserved membrane hypothetical protein [Gammaproteobacteria bacterium]